MLTRISTTSTRTHTEKDIIREYISIILMIASMRQLSKDISDISLNIEGVNRTFGTIDKTLEETQRIMRE